MAAAPGPVLDEFQPVMEAVSKTIHRVGEEAGVGQTVKACLLGQASASIVGLEIIGATTDEIARVGVIMRAMLKQDGPPPTGRWADLALLEPVRAYKSRHASTLLIFEAIDKAVAAARASTDANANAGAAAPCH